MGSQLIYINFHVCTTYVAADSDLNYLISIDELESLSNKYNITDISDSSILTKVQVLLITTSECEYPAVQSYLHPISGCNLFKHTQHKGDEFAFYIIGKYGECTSAIRKVNPEISTLHDVALMAIKCFPKLSAIFTVGTITGVGNRVVTYDVIVSTNICTYKVADDMSISKKERVNSSSLFCELCSQPPKWPMVENRLVNRVKKTKPHLYQGTILCGPDANEEKLLTLYPNAIGIDNNCAELFTDCHIMSNHFMSVKCVSNEQGTHSTAALLAADCLEHYLNNPQLPQFLTVSRGTYVIVIIYLCVLHIFYLCTYVAKHCSCKELLSM